MIEKDLKQLTRDLGSIAAALQAIEEFHRSPMGSPDTCAICKELSDTEQYVLTSALPHKVHVGFGRIQWLMLLVGVIGVQLKTEFHIIKSEWSICQTCRRKISAFRALHALIRGLIRVAFVLSLMVSIGTGGYMLFYSDVKPDEMLSFLKVFSVSTALWPLLAFIMYKTQNMGYGKFGVTSRQPFQCTTLKQKSTFADLPTEPKGAR